MLLGVVFGLLVLTLVWLTLTILVGVGGFLWAAHPVLLAVIVAAATLRANIRETVDPLEFSVQGGEAKRA
jgi:hypothetical protein